jgi:hypothetical protein
MFERFFFGLIDGFEFLFKLIVTMAMVVLGALPLTIIAIYNASLWWMLSYLLIFPVICGVFNTFDF